MMAAAAAARAYLKGEYPSPEAAANALGAPLEATMAVLEAAAVSSGPAPEAADQATQDARRAVCASCEFHLADIGMCGVCACQIELLVVYRSKKCPKEKW